MSKPICDECETVAHCSVHGCIPKVPTLEVAARQALEALEQYYGYMEPLTTVFGGPRVPAEQSTTSKVEKAITALRRALEPVAEPRKQPAYRAVKTVHEGKAYYVSEPEQQPAPATELREQQEPVEYWTVADGWVSEQAEVPAAAWIYPEFWDHCKIVGCGTAYRLPGAGRQPLYTSPPASKPWVGLTDEEMRDLEKQFNAERVRTSDEEYLIIYPGDYWQWQRAIEAKLRAKNGGNA